VDPGILLKNDGRTTALFVAVLAGSWPCLVPRRAGRDVGVHGIRQEGETAVTTPQDTEQYFHRAAVDAEGNRIGKITKVYRDDQTGQSLWLLVEMGLLGTRQSFAPIHRSRLDGEQPVVLAVRIRSRQFCWYVNV
jgi:hypothetical protein